MHDQIQASAAGMNDIEGESTDMERRRSEKQRWCHVMTTAINGSLPLPICAIMDYLNSMMRMPFFEGLYYP